jgi:hypothetical protein
MITPSFGLTATERVLPRLALDFTTAALDSRITFTRAGNTATRINASGFVESVNADVARFDFDPVTLACKGLLIEESRQNVCLQSNEHTTSPWATAAGGTGVVPVLTTNSAISPDGTQNATKIVFNVGSGTTTSDSSNWFQPRMLTAASYTGSLYVRGDVGGEQIYFRDPAGGFQLFTLTTSWQRLVFTATASTSDVARMGLSIRQGLGGVTINQTATVYVYGGQIELGAFATSYIPTTTTALTRNADVAVMTGTNFSDWYNAGAGGVVASVLPSTVSGTRPVLQFDDATANEVITLRGDATNPELVIVDGGSPQAQIDAGTIAANTSYNLGAAWNTDNCAAAVNGNASVTDTTATIPTVTQARLGSDGTNYLNGHLQTLRYWTQRIIDAEVQAFSK